MNSTFKAVGIGAAVATLLIIMTADSNEKYNPVKGTITSKWGNRTHPVTGKQSSFHNGVDIGVSSGTVIVSPFAGKVASINTNKAGGKQLIIDHDNGYRTGYAHLSGYLVKVGDKVKAGQAVAKSGNTGETTGPHLHFTLRQNGNLIDPTTVFDFKS